MHYLETLFLWFMFYSVLGWIYESILCSYMEKCPVNRGFLNGPYCPIYGAGAILNVLCLRWILQPIPMFFAAALLTGVLEYTTSWLMEEIFHARWWDYSDKKFNINGRVYLIGAIAFGSFSVIQMFWMQPRLVNITSALSEEMHSFFALGLFIILLIDIVYTLTKFSEFMELLKGAAAVIDDKVHFVLDETITPVIGEKVQSIRDLYGKAGAAYQGRMARINPQIRRMLISFPKMKSRQYGDRLKALRRRIKLEIKEKMPKRK